MVETGFIASTWMYNPTTLAKSDEFPMNLWLNVQKDQAPLDRFSCGRGPGRHPELAVDGAQVMPDGAGAEVEPLGDLGVGEALGHELEHFDLPGAEVRRIGRP